jgi:hypothetical protein
MAGDFFTSSKSHRHKKTVIAWMKNLRVGGDLCVGNRINRGRIIFVCQIFSFDKN